MKEVNCTCGGVVITATGKTIPGEPGFILCWKCKKPYKFTDVFKNTAEEEKLEPIKILEKIEQKKDTSDTGIVGIAKVAIEVSKKEKRKKEKKEKSKKTEKKIEAEKMPEVKETSEDKKKILTPDKDSVFLPTQDSNIKKYFFEIDITRPIKSQLKLQAKVLYRYLVPEKPKRRRGKNITRRKPRQKKAKNKKEVIG